jgi:hypothetical protein
VLKISTEVTGTIMNIGSTIIIPKAMIMRRPKQINETRKSIHAIKEQHLVLLFCNKFPDEEESIAIEFNPEKEYYLDRGLP